MTHEWRQRQAEAGGATQQLSAHFHSKLQVVTGRLLFFTAPPELLLWRTNCSTAVPKACLVQEEQSAPRPCNTPELVKVPEGHTAAPTVVEMTHDPAFSQT